MRGGTSRGLVFRREHLPDNPKDWDAIFLAAIGSPDPYGRQLDGLGGGISSLSKVVIVDRPSRPDADVNYTFGQVAVDRPLVDYSGNCGNMSSAVGPFAVDERLVDVSGDEAVLRLHNTNTGKIIVSRFPIVDGKAAVEGDYVLAGVAGSGARISLEFLDPGGALTGQLLPTGEVTDVLDVPGMNPVKASLVDATNPVVFVGAETLGCSGNEAPDDLEADTAMLERLERIRAAAAVRMGLAESPGEASERHPANPKIAMVAPPRSVTTLAGGSVDERSMDVTVRAISMGRPHRAVPLTAAMCLAVAARIEGTVVHDVTRVARSGKDDMHIGHPSGVIELATTVRNDGDWIAENVHLYRTARRLMEGAILAPAARLGNTRASVA
jgi:2-methylaconitate cis-trans-isomerase PrpF